VADKTNIGANKDILAKDSSLGELHIGRLDNIKLPEKPVGELKLYFDNNEISDLWIVITWAAAL